jgi:hypothetical protein
MTSLEMWNLVHSAATHYIAPTGKVVRAIFVKYTNEGREEACCLCTRMPTIASRFSAQPLSPDEPRLRPSYKAHDEIQVDGRYSEIADLESIRLLLK